MEKWNDEYKAIYDGPMCSQRNPFQRNKTDLGTEDCLYLNVYTPHKEKIENQNSNLPVMVYFHGGGFISGSASRAIFGPDHFLDHDVVLVTVNYRLGALGFLSTEDENCPGNFGLKDQVLALKFVRQNIKQFGGDPER